LTELPALTLSEETPILRVNGLSPGNASGVLTLLTADYVSSVTARCIFICEEFNPASALILTQYGSALIVEQATELSHPALISRELGIPCVSCDDLRSFPVGLRVEVNGTEGHVILLR
jgi:rifampicin phosphotransferase